MSLLDDVSIVVTPNGYKAGELYAVVPVPTEGAELVTNGDFSADASWTKGTGWTISSGKASSDGSQTGNSELKQQNGVAGVSLDLQVGKQYKMVIDITVSTGAITYIEVAGNTNSNDINATGVSTLYFSPTSTNDRITIAAGSTFVGSVNSVSVKEYTSADMDVTRATAATRVDENGLVNYAEVIGGELITNGDFATDTDWTKVNSTISGDIATINGTISGTALLYQNILTNGKTYNVAFTVLTNDNNAQNKVWNNDGSNLFLVSGTGLKTFQFTHSIASGNFLFQANGGVYTIDNVSVKEIQRDNVPRIDYTGGGCPHILAEPQRTNQITQNNQFDTTWVASNLGLTSGQNGIYNTTDAWLFNATNSLANVTISVSTSGENTYSVYAKAGTEDGIFIRFSGGSNPRAFFNLTNGTLISESGTTNTNVENIGNGWYRCSITGSETITDARIYVADSSGNFASSGNIYIQYSQLENGSYPTSIIPTSGSTVTRNQDIFTRDGISSLINSTEGVLFVEMALLIDDDSNKYITLTDVLGANKVQIDFDYSSSRLQYVVASGGYAQCNIKISYSGTNMDKLAFKWKENDFAVWINGVEIGSDTSGLAPIGLNTLKFSAPTGSNNFAGKVKQLQVYDTALTDEQLLQLTGESGTDFYESYAEMASALTYTIQ